MFHHHTIPQAVIISKLLQHVAMVIRASTPMSKSQTIPPSVSYLLEEDGAIEKLGHAQSYTYGNAENGDLKAFVRKEGNVDFSMYSEQNMDEEAQWKRRRMVWEVIRN